MSTLVITSQSEVTIVSAQPIRSQLCRPLIGVNMGGTHEAVASGGRMHQRERKSELRHRMMMMRSECEQVSLLAARSRCLWSAVCYNLMIRSLMRMIFISCDHWSKSSHPVTRTRHRAPGKLSQAISLNTFFHYSCYFLFLNACFCVWVFRFHFRLNREARDNLFNCHVKGNHSSFHNSTHTISLKIDQLIGSKITYS